MPSTFLLALMPDETEKSWPLPLELIEYIADSTCSSQLTLSSLALCCKTVSRTAIRALYRDIESLSRHAILALEVVLTSNGRLAALVERLIFPLLAGVDLNEDPDEFISAVDLLDLGTAGFYPTAVSSGFHMGGEEYEELVQSFHRTASVCIQLLELRLPTIHHDGIWNCRSLRQPFATGLISLTIVFEYHLCFRESIPVRLPQLEGLTILCAVMQNDLYRNPQSLTNFHLPKLKTLRCGYTKLAESLSSLLLSCARTLRTFVAAPSPRDLQPTLQFFRFPRILCGDNYSNLTTLGVVYDILSSRNKAQKIDLQAFTSLRNLTLFVVSRRFEGFLRSDYGEMTIAYGMPTVHCVTILDMNPIHKRERLTHDRLLRILNNLRRYFRNLSHLSVFKRGIHPEIHQSDGEGRVAKFESLDVVKRYDTPENHWVIDIHQLLVAMFSRH